MYSQEHRGYPTQNGVGSNPEQWSKTSHASSPSDHVQRPVLGDVEGKRRPIVSYVPPSNGEYLVRKTEVEVVRSVNSPLGFPGFKGLSTRVEPVKTPDRVVDDRSSGVPLGPVHRPVEDTRAQLSDHANGYGKGFNGLGNKVPFGTLPAVAVTDHKVGMIGRDEPVKTYGGVPEEKWSRPSSPSHRPLEDNRKVYPNHANSVPAKTYGGVPEEKWSRPSSPSHRHVEDNRQLYPNHANNVPAKTYGGAPEEKWSRPSSTSHRPLEENRKMYPNHANDVPPGNYSSGPGEKWNRPSSPSHLHLEDNRKAYPNHVNSVPGKTYGGVPEEKWRRPSSPSRRPVEDSQKLYPNHANSVPAKTYGGVPEEKWGRPSSPSHRPANGFPARTYGGVPEEKWGRPSSPSHWRPEDNRANVVPAGTYGVAPEEKWRRPSSPTHHSLEDNQKTYPSHINNAPVRTYSVPEEKWSRDRPLEDNRKPYPSYANGVPTNTYNGVPGDKWSSPSYPNHGPLEERRKTYPDPPLTSDYRQSSPPRTYPQPHRPSSPTHHSTPGQQIHEFIRKVHTEVSRPRFGPLSATYWHHSPPPTTGYGYGDDLGGKAGQYSNEHPMVTSGGWSRPSHATWASPPEGNLTRPTNDINAAVSFLMEATKPSGMVPPSSRVTVPYPNGSGSGSDVYGAPAMERKEGARRYVNFSTRHTVIDSREAARKYGGANV